MPPNGTQRNSYVLGDIANAGGGMIASTIIRAEGDTLINEFRVVTTRKSIVINSGTVKAKDGRTDYRCVGRLCVIIRSTILEIVPITQPGSQVFQTVSEETCASR